MRSFRNEQPTVDNIAREQLMAGGAVAGDEDRLLPKTIHRRQQ